MWLQACHEAVSAICNVVLPMNTALQGIAVSQTFVLDKEGKVIMAYQGPKGSDPKDHVTKSLEALKSQSSSGGGGMATDASKAGQNAPTAGSMESLRNLPDEANDSYTGAETLK